MKPTELTELTEPKFIRPKPLALRWGLSSAHIYDAVAEGKIPATRVGAAILVSLAFVQAFEERARLPNGEPWVKSKRGPAPKRKKQ